MLSHHQSATKSWGFVLLPGQRPERAEAQERRDFLGSWLHGESALQARTALLVAGWLLVGPPDSRERSQIHRHRSLSHSPRHGWYCRGLAVTTDVTGLGNKETRAAGRGRRGRWRKNSWERDLEPISGVECKDDHIVDRLAQPCGGGGLGQTKNAENISAVESDGMVQVRERRGKRWGLLALRVSPAP